MTGATEPRGLPLALALAVAVAVAGCGPQEAGTIKVPEELRRTGPGGFRGKPVSTGPGDFVVEPPTKGGPAKGPGK
jgi:hypothetical protein